MPVPCSCGSDDRCECGCPQDCYQCGNIVALSGGDEWPERGVIRCWDCQQQRVESLESSIRELILQCERRIDHLAADSLIDDKKRATLNTENRRFILRLQAAMTDQIEA